MVRAVLLLALAVALPSGAAPQQTRPRISANGKFTVRFSEDGSRCKLEVLVNSDASELAPKWSLPKCVATADDLFYVSEDGERVWVVYPLVKKPAKKGYAALRKVAVATLVNRSGQTLKVARLGDFWGKRKQIEVRELGQHFKWVEGTVGLTGKPPRVTAGNRLELETLEPKTVALKF